MAVAHETVLFQVHDCKVYPMLTDSSAASPTYGTAVDIPGIGDFSFDPNLVTAEIKGDGRVVAKKGRIDRMNVSATYAKLALDVLGVLLGGEDVEDGGTGEAETARWALTNATAGLPYYKLAASIEDADVGISQVVLTFYKCTTTGGTLVSQSQENFGQPSFTAEAIQPDHADTPMMDVEIRETLVAL